MSDIKYYAYLTMSKKPHSCSLINQAEARNNVLDPVADSGANVWSTSPSQLLEFFSHLSIFFLPLTNCFSRPCNLTPSHQLPIPTPPIVNGWIGHWLDQINVGLNRVVKTVLTQNGFSSGALLLLTPLPNPQRWVYLRASLQQRVNYTLPTAYKKSSSKISINYNCGYSLCGLELQLGCESFI